MSNKNAPIETARHSLSHIMAAAVKKLYPDVKLGIGPAIENGFYYDYDFSDARITPEDLAKIEKEMQAIIKQNIDFIKKEISQGEAEKLFANEPYKLELIKEFTDTRCLRAPDIGRLTLYQSGDFVDLCAGPHIENTSEINTKAFKLTKIAGAYWRGDEKRPMLTRVYGLAFESEKELIDYLQMMEEAEKRDHRKLGKELDLFLIDPTVGMGLAMWQPKGAMLWRIMEDFWYQEHLKNGYELVRTPHIGSRKLWETSGHWGFYNESMYPPLEVSQTLKEQQDGKKSEIKEEYLLKPMNCPFHVVLYNSKPKSYRDLPIRWAECGTVYRYEKSGELSGLTRVRGFTQDDAHIICTKEQVKDELKRVADFIIFILNTFGFKEFNVYLSLRDPNNKEKYAGNDEGWEFTQKILEEVAKEQKLDYKKQEGEAAFYGPKLDYKIKDCLSREWQCSTLQFDFNLPERFDMSFTNQKGERERPYVLHRALFGSFERFIGVLIEHYAGAFPVWLSPIQAIVLPIGQDHQKYGQEVLDLLKQNNIRAILNLDNETIGKKIREAEMQKIPYILVVGDKEISAKSVAVRQRGAGDKGAMTIDKFIATIKEEIINKK
ncbi:threonine--tRNA ligase [bacterium (Candidatus Gribaldobacteria) CG_4_10_14_0_2_um_filter_41_16]|uniref:Threonine--tRNA ligase n=2 Tax=Candidatus Gribaldobacteria TaxID=2798536 RepID=A0A2M7VIV4_9BACT|nr:MAG: threonine--tRNA ligase [Parcubacteria group bacterium CG1_02_41_26]PIR91203.1 MAG: threonine--tRNA ligase [bacterium (Candidatus Gribaldobacteria) CG10_big_fil_rev_8_21_14_0_10_41_12]PJA01771.1 MAG: threonine--tRNA ligase [bacterium (Candidatus Gribaldobacteria) CG_4_10_14_0_2_um_filter_41_16]